MTRPADPRRNESRTILVIDDADQLGASVADFLTPWGHRTVRLTQPDDAELRKHLVPDIDTVAVVSREDIVALRYALLVEHLRPGIRLIVTIFDRTVAGEVARAVPNCTVLAMTDAIVPSLLAACLHPDLATVLTIESQPLAAYRDGRVERLTRVPKTCSGRRPRRGHRAAARIRSLNTSARALILSFTALLMALGIESALGVLVLHESWPDATWQATRVLTTVGSSAAAELGPGWYKILSTAIMLMVLAAVGLFTASLVDRVNDQRLTAILGRRAIPGHDHVIVVGLGQVGLRLCLELRRLGIKVVAIERSADAPCLPLAREAGIPVVIGRGGDRFMLRRLGITEARALAAVSSDGLENVAVAVAARATAPNQRVVLRSGGGDDIATESHSLFRIGAACDVTRIIGALAACHCLDAAPLNVFPSGQAVHALLADHTVVDLATWQEVPSR